LRRKLGASRSVVLPGARHEPRARNTPWIKVHYLNDPKHQTDPAAQTPNQPSRLPRVQLFQIDNEPMNNGFTSEEYAEIVNVYGARL